MKAPLKTVLKNFLDHVEDLELRKALGDDQYETEFHELKKLTDKLKEDPAYPCSFGLKDVNRPKNRYKDIVPYDFSRVILPKYEGVPGSDYINASYIKGASGAFAYIAAQGPLPNTVVDFWRMIWVCDVQVVVMACNEKEAGKFKCEAYWPNPGEIKQYGNISIELIKSCQVCPDFLVRTFLVKCDSEMRDVYQFHYTSWPDHGVPDSVQPILDLVRLMRDCQASETVPIVIHCSAGCGRTGTICAVDYVWACLRHGKLNEDFSLYHIALELRRQRIAMIQTKEQYILAHKAVAAMFVQQLKVIDCHIYENIDEDGEPLMWKEVKEFVLSDSNSKVNTKDKSEVNHTDAKKTDLPSESKRNSNFYISSNQSEKTQASSCDSLSHISSVGIELSTKTNDCVMSSTKNSESSFSRNSILSAQSYEDSIPFIDEDEICIRPNCGRAYLDIPSCDSISKIVNRFDPFVDKVSLGTDDSSPEGDPLDAINKIKDFQLASNTLNGNTKIPNFKEYKSREENTFELLNSQSDTIDCSKKMNKQFLRESFPSCSHSEKFQKNSADKDEVGKSHEDVNCAKKVGKATVVRRPSISKLKALFEKTGISAQRNSSDGSKRLLFRNNSQHVSRAGSAPPSLNCMDRNSVAEKESILMMVTRKFRSSSVRSEREMQTKQNDKTLNRRSATETMRESFNALTRTMSFNINKAFKSYSPSKTKLDISKKSETKPNENIVGTYKPKSPDPQKGNSLWYDKPSLPCAIAIVKPTGKFDAKTDFPTRSPPVPEPLEKNKSIENSNCITKPAKLKDFFSSLNKKDAKDSLTLWYNESGEAQAETNKNISELNVNTSSANSSYKSMSKTLPFLPMTPWKKVKSPLCSPDSLKSFSDQFPTQPNSKFYTDVIVSVPHVADNLPDMKHTDAEVYKCPVPEEIIPLNVDSNKFWPPVSLSDSSLETKSGSKTASISSIAKDSVPKQIAATELIKAEKKDKLIEGNDVPPAIPKKMVIGKTKNVCQDLVSDRDIEPQTLMLQETNETVEQIVAKPSSENEKICKVPVETNDLYINVNITAIKNLEQIENTLRKNPRGAIIDLTSRESYSMEEELISAVNQLSDTSGETKSSSEQIEKKQASLIKPSSKFPGYEVIWPEHQNISVQRSQSSSKVPLVNNSKLPEKNSELFISNENKTGLCYSPPLRRSVSSSLAKSQSCGNLDWLEPEDSTLRESSNTPTKRLVNEAVVELNTLLNQLTTRTLSEDVDFDSKSKEKAKGSKTADQGIIENTLNTTNIEPNDTLVHSVTLVTKSCNSGSSPKEEEIVFHFPPPPRGPPPKDLSPVESFNIVCKDGSLVVKQTNMFDKSGTGHKEDSKSGSHLNSMDFPQPAPRKSKQESGLRRSSSYTNINPSSQSKNKGYENIFLEKYQTMSRLQIKPECDELNILDKSVPIQKSLIIKKSSNSKQIPSYVNISDMHNSKILLPSSIKSSALNIEKCELNKSAGAESKECSSNDENSTTSQVPPKFVIKDTKNDSIYGKIYKISDQKMQRIENFSDSNMIKDSGDNKRKSVPSKKTERAPMPPNINQVEVALKISPNNSMIPKKLPSRKLEKAPPPPQPLQKSSSAMIIPKKNLQSSQQYVNFPSAHRIEDKQKLPAVHENVPNTVVNSNMNSKPVHSSFTSDKFVNSNMNNKPVSNSFTSDKFVNSNINNKPVSNSFTSDRFVSRGLSHSHSDVSVYRALKEHRIQSAVQGHKILNLKSLMSKKDKNTELVNVSSSDSDSSYERIFLTKDEQVHTSVSTSGKEKEHQSPRIYKKEIPVAPPRSKRRSTVEVQYAQVKAKEASLTIPTSKPIAGGNATKNSRASAKSEDEPPAIPLKTKDAFEMFEENSVANLNKKDENCVQPVSNFTPVK